MAGSSLKLYSRGFAQALVVTLLAVNPLAKAEEVLVDRLAAVVNGASVTYSEVMSKVKKGNLVEVGAFPAKETDPPYDVALQDLINKRLVMQKVEEADIEVDDDAVEKEISSFLEKRNMTREAFRQALAGEGLEYSQYFQDFKNQMLIRKFQGRFILPSVKISEKDLEVFYFKLLGASPEGVQMKLRKIFIEVDPSAPEDVVEAKVQLVESVKQKLAEGMPFADAVKVYSNESGAADTGGLMPALSLKDLNPEIKAAVEPLEKGQSSEPIKVANGYYIFFLEDKFLSDAKDFEAKRQELEFKLRQQEMEKETLHWLESQRNTSKITIISN